MSQHLPEFWEVPLNFDTWAWLANQLDPAAQQAQRASRQRSALRLAPVRRLLAECDRLHAVTEADRMREGQ
jgi:hypothetical protein